MPVETLCRRALDILLRRIGGDADSPAEQVLIPTQLVIGATT
jgi:DNA-binding LacI/PurR family transcriptional regulator